MSAAYQNSTQAQGMLQRLVNLRGQGQGQVQGQGQQKVETLDTQTLAAYENVGKITVQLAQMIYDSSYIDTALSDEGARIGALNMDTRRNIYKVRQMTLTEAYKANYNRFITNIMYFTCFVTMLSMSVGATYLNGTITTAFTAFAAIGTILVVYAMIMVYLFASAKGRTSTDWNQFYFPPSQMLVKAAQDSTVLVNPSAS